MFYSSNARMRKVHGRNACDGMHKSRQCPHVLYSVFVKVCQIIYLFFAAQLSFTEPLVLGNSLLENKG